MAWLESDPSGNFHVCFRLGKRRFRRSLKTTVRRDAERLSARLEENLVLVERGRLEIPNGADIACFLLSDGRVAKKLELKPELTLTGLFEDYFGSMPAGALEESTIEGMRIHERQLYRILGKTFAIQNMTTADLQRYVDKRAKEPGRRGRKVTPTTLKKAIVTLRTVWNWGVKGGRLTGKFPSDGVIYPKANEKPPFQTWKEIEQQIARGGLTSAEEADLWDCLFLTLVEIEKLLKFVQESARQPFIYPMFCFAAHTGARRSEIVRTKLSDLDFTGGTIIVHERKRNHSMTTTRRVPMSPFLRNVLTDWLAQHPGGLYIFCQNHEVVHSKKQRSMPQPITRDEAHDHFKRTLADSKWKVIRGWHLFRHSFCSNCAAKGIDQRLINAWVGHQTEDMVRRYRHLIPDQQQSAIVTVFGTGQQSLVADAL